MRYLKDTFLYLFVYGKGKRFLLMFLSTLLPSALFAYGIRAELLFVNVISPPDYKNWGELWLSYFSPSYSYVAIILGIFVSVLATACIMGTTIRYFRVGTSSPKQFFRSFNDYALPSLLYSGMNILIYAVAYTLYTLFAFMWYNFTSPIAYAVLSYIVFFGLAILVIYIMSSLTLWLPFMCIKGIYSHNALSTAFYQSRSKQKMFLPGHFAVGIILLATALISYLVSNIWYIAWIIDTVGYSVAYTVSLIFITTAYFGENSLPREDFGVSPYKKRRF